MVRIGASPTPAAAPATLPKVSFTKVEDDAFVGVGSVSDSQARSYGYNDGSAFRLPEQYIRYIEPLESELAVQVEYDMDEQDQEWLDGVNAERRNANLDKISYESFEIIMDRLEKEWFDLTKNLPKPDLAMPSEDSTCAICDDSEGENTNAIVFCDGCNLAVHQDCYGVPYIPEGQWLCRKCTVSPENPVQCILCPNEGGAFKQTVHGEWVHLLCAIWVPETRVANDVFMEPVTGVDRIPKQRWKLKCQICEIREGACIQCIKNSCFSAFHATCARKEKLLMPMKATQGSEAPTLAAYCEKHLPREQAETRLAALHSEHDNGTLEVPDANQSSKTARAYAKTYKPGPPLVPKIIVDRIFQYIGKVNIRHKREFIVLVCKYWSLKREARRGAPLLKRLHLEPWTASANGRSHSDEDKAFKLTLLKDLRDDLERLRTLSDVARKREIQKLKEANCIQQVLRSILYPFYPVMCTIFENIRSGDKSDYFLNPVSKADVPDYYDVIKRPMCWSLIDKKLTEHQYLDLHEFKGDIYLVLDNAMVYNKPDTAYFRAARRIKTVAERTLPDLDRFVNQHLLAPSIEQVDPSVEPEQPVIGNLEPSLHMLDLLVTTEHIRAESRFVLDKQPVDTLFSYEFGEMKPPSTPPPAPPTPAPAAKARDKKLGRARAKERRAAAVGVAMAHPKTRRGRAAAGVVEAEAPAIALPIEAQSEAVPVQPTEEPAPVPPVEQQSESVTEGEPPAKKQRRDSKHWKRAPIVLPGQSELPLVVGDIDARKSFSMFDEGWILPEGQRRHPRPPSEKSNEPRRKGGKPAERPVSTTSNVTARTAESVSIPAPEAGSTASPTSSVTVMEAIAAEAEEPPVEYEPTPPRSVTPMEVDVEEPDVPTEAPASTQTAPSPQSESNGATPEQEEVDVETLREEEEESPVEHAVEVVPEKTEAKEREPTPVIMLAESSPVQQDVSSETEDALVRETTSPLDQSEDVSMTELDDDQQSELTALSDSDSTKSPSRAEERETSQDPSVLLMEDLTQLSTQEEPEGSEPPVLDAEGEDEVEEEEIAVAEPSSSKKRPQRKSEKSKGKSRKQAMLPFDPEAGKIVLRRGQAVLEGGTLVWAKFTGFPWWPAVVFDYDDEVVPELLKAQWTRKELESEHLHIVRFFDEHDTWQTIGLDQILMLGEDDNLDEDMLAAKSHRQSWKNSRHKYMCRKAYLRAREEMEIS